jgi:hypothetical protein
LEKVPLGIEYHPDTNLSSGYKWCVQWSDGQKRLTEPTGTTDEEVEQQLVLRSYDADYP